MVISPPSGPDSRANSRASDNFSTCWELSPASWSRMSTRRAERVLDPACRGEAAGQRDGQDEDLVVPRSLGQQPVQPIEMLLAGFRKGVRGAEHADLVGRGPAAVPGEQRLGERALRGRRHRRGGGDPVRGGGVVTDPFQSQRPGQLQADPVEEVDGDLVRPADGLDDLLGAGHRLVGLVVDAELDQHCRDVHQHAGQRPLCVPPSQSSGPPSRRPGSPGHARSR